MLLKQKDLFITSAEARGVAERVQVSEDLVSNLASVISELLANNFSEPRL